MESISDNVGLLYAVIHIEIFKEEIFTPELYEVDIKIS